jgi:acyl-coenzyme A synthetase/AMP-(fatty) acid ligase
MTHLGRVDFQIKVLGHRVELGEIEAAVRDACGVDGVVAVGWPKTESGCGGIEVFVERHPVNQIELRQQIALKLPAYMVPSRFHFLDYLPRNINGKYDRGAILKLLDEEHTGQLQKA